MTTDYFDPKHKFQDDIWGQIDLNDLERDVVDAPEFQRLFRTSQLGFVNLVYPTANHSRGAHSIGACNVAKLLIDNLVQNTRKQYESNSSKYAPFEIAPAEIVLIRLGALLHDISHVPLSHDVERKTHKILGENDGQSIKVRSRYGHYDKHDDYDLNPLLYLVLFDREASVLARVLAGYSAEFHCLIKDHKTDERFAHLHGFVHTLSRIDPDSWNPDIELLPSLLFHLLIYETPAEASSSKRQVAVAYEDDQRDWSLGPTELADELHEQWYQPYRHDIIGNTLSADLIDYLKRDSRRLGIAQHVDLHLLNYYVLVRSTERAESKNGVKRSSAPEQTNPVYRCAIDVDDSKRGTTRTTLVNDVFGLLTNRYVIHEKAVMHRVVQSATAMLSRALMLLADRKPTLRDLVRLGEDAHALQSEPLLFLELLQACESSKGDTAADCVRLEEARQILLKLVDRRVYRPLMIIPGDRAARRLPSAGQVGTDRSEFFLRTLAAIVESPHCSPFLLFVSACVEKFLQSAFDSASDVCEYTKVVVEDEHLTNAAMNLVPSRVIISASPYKQLYKDPAVVVALPEWNGRIDELTSKGRSEAAIQEDDTLFDLVDASIHDADAKYAALWKLYIFVSDGLYYTGLLNKLNGRSRSEQASQPSVDDHAGRLRQAQLFLLAALEAICEDWFRSCKSPGDLADSDRRNSFCQRLQSKLHRGQFIAVLNLWKAKVEHAIQQDNDPLQGLSTVSISQYVHGDPLLDPSERRCRDIRYKADRGALQSRGDSNGDSTQDSSELSAFLAANGIPDCHGISHGEFQQLVHRYNAAKSIFADELNNGAPHSSALKLLWMTDIPKPRGKPEVAPAQKPKPSQLRWDLPETGEEIQEWLLNDVSRRLKNVRVRRQLEGEVSSIVSFLEGVPVVNRRQVFEDLQDRLAYESRVLTNDIKDGQIMHMLRQEWGHLAKTESQSTE